MSNINNNRSDYERILDMRRATSTEEERLKTLEREVKEVRAMLEALTKERNLEAK